MLIYVPSGSFNQAFPGFRCRNAFVQALGVSAPGCTKEQYLSYPSITQKDWQNFFSFALGCDSPFRQGREFGRRDTAGLALRPRSNDGFLIPILSSIYEADATFQREPSGELQYPKYPHGATAASFTTPPPAATALPMTSSTASRDCTMKWNETPRNPDPSEGPASARRRNGQALWPSGVPKGRTIHSVRPPEGFSLNMYRGCWWICFGRLDRFLGVPNMQTQGRSDRFFHVSRTSLSNGSLF